MVHLPLSCLLLQLFMIRRLRKHKNTSPSRPPQGGSLHLHGSHAPTCRDPPCGGLGEAMPSHLDNLSSHVSYCLCNIFHVTGRQSQAPLPCLLRRLEYVSL